jgi:hypothetical protein
MLEYLITDTLPRTGRQDLLAYNMLAEVYGRGDYLFTVDEGVNHLVSQGYTRNQALSILNSLRDQGSIEIA